MPLEVGVASRPSPQPGCIAIRDNPGTPTPPNYEFVDKLRNNYD